MIIKMCECLHIQPAQNAPSQKKHRSVIVSKAIFPQAGGKIYFAFEAMKTNLNFEWAFDKRGPKKLYNSNTNQKIETQTAAFKEVVFG